MKNKKYLKYLVVVIMFCLVQINVFAATDSPSGTTSATETQRDASSDYKKIWDNLESNYKKGIISETISGTKYVLIYGKSTCSNGTCSISYANSSSYTNKDVLSRSIKCQNGEKYISYQQSGSAKITNETSDAYWSEEYQVVCSSEGKGTYVELVDNNNDGNNNSSGSTTTTTTKSSNSGSSSDSNDNGSNYNSSSTVNQEQTGVTTYFIVLGLVALVSSVFMLCVKKYNLFKNI